MPRLRLLQLASPSLPVGAFTYSQGLEWAVECGWVHDEATLADWLADLLEHSMGRLEVPVLARLYRALEMDDLPPGTPRVSLEISTVEGGVTVTHNVVELSSQFVVDLYEIGYCDPAYKPSSVFP